MSMATEIVTWKKTAVFILLAWLLVWGRGLENLPSLVQADEPEPILILYSQAIEPSDAKAYTLRLYGLFPSGDTFRLLSDLRTLTVVPVGNPLQEQLVADPAPAPVAEPFYITLLIDVSGSMAQNLAAVRRQARQMVRDAPAEAHFSVITFDNQVNDYLTFTNDKDAVLHALNQIAVQDGSTCLNDALYTAVQSLTQLPPTPRRAIALFSDGRDEAIRGRAGPCSRRAYDEALHLARSQPVPIPIHTLHYPHLDEGCIEPLPSHNNVTTGLTAACAEVNAQALPTLHRILDSFEAQWVMDVIMYTPPGIFDMQITAEFNDGTMAEIRVPYRVSRPYLPPQQYISPRAVAINKIVYDERQQQLNIHIQLCTVGSQDPAVCDPTQISTLELLVVDTFADEKMKRTEVTDFLQTRQPQIISLKLPRLLLAEHWHLVRVQAQEGITEQHRHPFAEAYYLYQPHLDVDIGQPQLRGWGLRPALVIPSVNVTRSGDDIEPVVPGELIVDGYLVRPDAIYWLSPVTIAPGADLSYRVPAGWDNYELALYVQDARDGLRMRTALIETSTGMGGTMMVFLRRLLVDHPYLALFGLFLFLGLLCLIYFVVRLWLRLRPAPLPDLTPAVERKVAPQLQLKVESAADEARYGQTFVLDLDGENDRGFTLGQRDCHLNFEKDETIARRHAAITRREQVYFIESYDAYYSTYINEQEIITGQPVPFRPAQGDKIRLGERTRLTFHLTNGTQTE
jgi:hypothetical protein